MEQQMVHGGDITTWRERHPHREFVDFSANINPLGMPKSVKQAYLFALEECAGYPDPLCRELKKALSRYEDIAPESIVCGNGASDLIYRIAQALRPRTALLLAPTFSEYGRALGQVGCTVGYHLLEEDKGFDLDESILQELPGKDLVFLCNPNNPTGVLAAPSLMKEIAARCAGQGTCLVVDECFLDFHPSPEKHTLKTHVEKWGRLIVLKAFTKIFAMPGLRLGYALAAPALANILEGAGPCWNVSLPAQRCGVAAVEEKDYLVQTRALIPEQRGEFSRGLRELGFQVYSSQANYLLFRSGATDLADRMAEKGFLIRDCANYRGLGHGYYRVAVKNERENNALLGAFKEL